MELRQKSPTGGNANPATAGHSALALRWVRLFAFLAFAAALFPNPAHGQGEAFTIGNYQVVNSARVGRLEDEFTLKADLTNSGAAANNVLCVVTSTSPDTTITRGSLLFPSVGAGATQTSTDTFTIRQRRVTSFDPSVLSWQFTVNAPVFNVAITSPADGLLTNASTVQVTGTTSGPATSVKINTSTASVSGSTFSANILLNEGGNTLTAVATGPLGQVATTSIYVSRDSQPPRVAIDSPVAGTTVSTDRVTVTGTINDTVIGTVNPVQGSVTVNGRPATLVNRTFVAADVPLTPGANSLIATGTDRAGNVATSAPVTVTYNTTVTARVQAVSGDHQSALIGAPLPQPLVVLATDEHGAPATGKDVIFKVCQNDGVVTGGGRIARSVIVPTGPDGRAQVTFQLGTRVGAGNNQVQASVVGFEGVAMFCASSTPAPAAMLVLDAGNRQSGVPGQPLPRPFVAIVIDSGNNRLANVPITFTATEGGGNFGGLSVKTVATDSDGRAAATLILGPEEGIENNRVEATFPGNTGLPVAFTASGMVPGDALQTSISGVVLDNTEVPVPGATVRILGTSRTGVSDAQGQFLIKPVPVGTLRMAVDGSTVTRPGSWVNLDYTITTVAGQDNGLGMPVRLLEIDTAHGVNVSPTTGGTITLPDYPGFSLKILPGSVTFPDGGGQTGTVTATIVHADKTPEVPNFGQQPRFIVSLNPKGCIFNPPAQMCIPNLDGHPPGQKTEMYSFDDTLNAFVSIGTGTTSTDGTQICSDPGSGVVRGGWHCGGNPQSVAATIKSKVSVDTEILILCKGDAGKVIASGTPTPPHEVPPPGPYDWKKDFTTIPTSIYPGDANITSTEFWDPIAKISTSTATITGTTAGRVHVNVRYRCKSAQWSASQQVKIEVVELTEVVAKRSDESDAVLHHDPGAFCLGDKISGRVRTSPNDISAYPISILTGSHIRWELRLVGAAGDTTKAQGAGVGFDEQVLDTEGTWKIRFYCDDNKNGKHDVGEASRETGTFGVKRLTVDALIVNRHTSTSLADFTIDSNLAVGNFRLHKNDRRLTTGGDVRCCLDLQRSGPVRSFGTAGDNLDVITTDEDLNRVFAMPGDIKIVTSMAPGVCNTGGGTPIGCGYSGGSLIITPAATASAWLHEWGHVKGLHHPVGPDGSQDSADHNYIMHKYDYGGDTVTEVESQAFEQ